MRKLASLFVVFGMCALPAFAAVETYKDVAVVDVNCSTKAAVTADPDSHPRSCALKCAGSGFGIVTQDKQERPPAGRCERRCAGRYVESHFYQTFVMPDTGFLRIGGKEPGAQGDSEEAGKQRSVRRGYAC
jgi:hypothetical protein